MSEGTRISADQITIAITVYNRRQFLKQAISSALNQTVPVRVMVVEDCGPDASLQAFVKDEFGGRVEYIRNPKRRGLFGNWNACLKLCQTEWISILHDDDFLAPDFIEAMIELGQEAPGHFLYFGKTKIVNEQGDPVPNQEDRIVPGRWIERTLMDILYAPFPFPGQLFPVQAAKQLGGFRETSFFCGDWEMWAKLMAAGGAAQSARVLAFFRYHGGLEKGTNQVIRDGKQYPTLYVQHKRILSILPQGGKTKFDRAEVVRRCPVPTRFLLRYSKSLSPRLLAYHVRLYLLSKPPHWRYAVFQQLARLLGPGFVKGSSELWNCLSR